MLTVCLCRKATSYNVPTMALCKMTWWPVQALPFVTHDGVSSLDLLGDSNQASPSEDVVSFLTTRQRWGHTALPERLVDFSICKKHRSAGFVPPYSGSLY